MSGPHINIRSLLAAVLIPIVLTAGFAMYDADPTRIGPTISSVDAESITFNSTMISWTTDVASDSQVSISMDPGLSGAWNFTDRGMVLTHSVRIYDLEPSTKYYFSVSSTDDSDHTTTDDNGGEFHNFTTAPSNDPSINSMISRGPTTGDRFNITVEASDDWGVDEVRVTYSIDGSDEEEKDLKWAGMIWYVHVDIPSDALIMNYTIECRDIEGNTASTGPIEANVTDNDAPVIHPFDYDPPTSGDNLVIDVILTDNIQVETAYLRVWYDLGSGMTNRSMERLDGDTWRGSVVLTDDPSRQLRFKVTSGDTSGNWASTGTMTPDIIDNDPPVADAGEDIFIENGEEATLDGSGSTDNDAILNYTWTLVYGNRTIYFHTVNATFTFGDPGIFNATLRVEDNSSLTSVDHVLIYVEDTIPPVPVITGDLSVPAGNKLVLSAENSTDNDAILEYRWTFFDGENITVDGPVLSRVFLNRGFFDITLTVFDRWNLSSSMTVEAVIVDSVDPVPVVSGDITTGAGKEVVFDGSGSTDDGSIKVYYWNFEDGGEEKELFGEVVYYTFNNSGKYDVYLTVFDQSGNFASENFTVTVVDRGTLRGRVLDTDGDPVSGVPVKVKASDGKTYSTETGDDGNFSIDVPQGEVEWTIGSAEHEKIKGTSQITALEVTTLDLSDEPLKEKDDLGIVVVISILAVVIIAVIILGIIVFARIKKAGEIEEEIESEGSPDQTIGSMPYPVAQAGQQPVHREMEVEGEVPLFTRGPEDEPEIEEDEGSRVDDLFEE